MRTRSQNMPCQEKNRNIRPPMTGDRIGAMPFTSMSIEKNRVSAGPLHTSRATARAMTMPTPPEKPWTKRKAMNMWMLDDKIQQTVDAVNTTMPNSSGRRRPFSSLTGPAKIWPMAMPAIDAVRVIWIMDVPTEKSAIIKGKAGRYISVESGANAASIPKNTVNKPMRCLYCSFVIR